MTTIGKDFPVRAHAFLLSSEKRASSAAISPADTLCFDIFSLPPGDSDVINQGRSAQFQRDEYCAKFGPDRGRCYGLISYVLHGRLQTGVVSDLILPKRRSPPSPHGISKRSMCRPTRLQFRGRLTRLGETSEDDAQSLHRGTGGGTYMKESARNTGSPWAWSGMTNQTPARERLGALMGWRRGS